MGDSDKVRPSSVLVSVLVGNVITIRVVHPSGVAKQELTTDAKLQWLTSGRITPTTMANSKVRMSMSFHIRPRPTTPQRVPWPKAPQPHNVGQCGMRCVLL